MNSEQVLKTFLITTALTLICSCSPTSSDLKSFHQASTEETSIVGGADSTSDYAQLNGIVGIYDMEIGGLCTGNLIGNGLVLTAGHCANVNNPTKMVVFFGTDLHEIELQAHQGHHENIRHVLKVIRHENYKINQGNDAKSSDDISLIRFEGSAPDGFKFVPVATSLQASLLNAGASLTLAGYGLSAFKMDQKTGQKLESAGAGVLREVSGIKVLSVLESLQEITLDQSEGHGACHGDSGGPAYLTDPVSKTSYLVGVTSRGSGNCDQTAVYTGVIGYESWIKQNSIEVMR